MLNLRAVSVALMRNIKNLFAGLLGAGNLGLIFRVKKPIIMAMQPLHHGSGFESCMSVIREWINSPWCHKAQPFDFYSHQSASTWQ